MIEAGCTVADVRRSVRMQLVGLLARFGLTPADRPRVKVLASAGKSDSDRFFTPRLSG